MQEGMRIKSKDIIFFNSIFYLAINLFIDIFVNTKIKFIIYLFSSLNWKSLQVSHRQAHDELVKLRFSNFNQLSTS